MAQKAFRDTYIEEKEGETRERLPPQAPAFPPLRWYHKVILKICSTYLGRAADAVRVTRRADSQASSLSSSSQPLPSGQNQNNTKSIQTENHALLLLLFRAETKFPRGATSSPRPLPVAEPSSLSGEQPAAPSHRGDGGGQEASSGPGLEAGSGRPRGSPASSGPSPASSGPPPFRSARGSPRGGDGGRGRTGGAAGFGGIRAN